MKRQFISDIVTSAPWGEDGYYPVTIFYPSINFGGSPPGDPETGAPYRNWVLIEVTAGSDEDLAAFSADPRVDTLPDLPLDTPVSQMPAIVVSSLRAILSRRGIGAGLVDEAVNYGAILAGITLRANAAASVPALAQLDL